MDMKNAKEQLLTLSDTFARHAGITHWAVSMRLLGRGDFFQKLWLPNRDLRMGTYERLLAAFSSCWPEDLEWPADVPRPSIKKDAA